MVDIFSMVFQERTRNFLDQPWEVVFCFAWVIVTWRVAYGLIDMYSYNDRSMMLRMTIWIIFVFARFGLALSTLTALANAIEQFLRTNTTNTNNTQTEAPQ